MIFDLFPNPERLCNATLSILFILSGFHLSAQNSCLIDKDAGIDADLSELDEEYNVPSPYAFAEMIAVNDGGDRFYDYTSNYSNPDGLPNVMLEITDVVRYFVQMQEDFAVTIDSSQLPAATNGNPISMTATMVSGDFFRNNKETLQGLKDQGFEVHACFAALSPTDGTYTDLRDFPEQWYFVNEWTNNPGVNYEGVKLSVKNYTKAFINTMSPPGCVGNNCIVDVFEMGNEPWGYPDPKIYHAIITGAWEAFNEVYGAPSNWKMDFIAPSFQAFRANILDCNNPNQINAINLQNDAENGIYDLCQYDEIGEFLDLPCAVMDDIDAINIHPYGFKGGNIYTFKTEPEHPESEFNQIKNAVVWRDVNFPDRSMPVYTTEFGWSSQPEAGNGNGEQGQAANLLRGILIQSRYHINRTYIYNAYEDGNFLYNWHALYETGDSNGLGYNNSLGGRKKPAFFAVKDFRERFAGKVFYKALQEDRNGVYAYVLANPDGSDPYLVFWTPQETHDYNINELGNEVTVDWSEVLPGLGLATETATTFALNDVAVNTTFTATSEPIVAGSAIIKAKRMPAFIKLVPVDGNCGTNNVENIVPGCGVTIEIDGLNIDFVSTTNTSNLIIIVRTDDWQVAKTLCNDYNQGEDCNGSSSIQVPSSGDYIVDLQIAGSNACTFPINVTNESLETDIDGDGICSEEDCDDNDPDVGASQTPGSNCDDRNANTCNDEIQADGCTCVGVASNCGSGVITGCGVTVEVDGLNVNFVSTTNMGNLIIFVRTDNWQVAETLCNDYNDSTMGTGCNSNSSISVLEAGEYIVDVQIEGSPGSCIFPVVINEGEECQSNLNLFGEHNSPAVYRASSTITSTVVVNANVSYYSNDRISLEIGFETNIPYNFNVAIGGGCN